MVSAAPQIDELRAVCQPESTMSRRNGEHWLAVLVLRRVSLRVTRQVVRTSVTPNQLTGLMIVVGIVAATVLSIGGWGAAVGAFALILVYFLLDLVDGEVARWKAMTSITGVYLDRLGHYMVEAAVMAGFGLRAGGGVSSGWAVLGVATGLLVVLQKAETDLVDVARARTGHRALADAPEAVELRSASLGRLRRFAQLFKIHQITGALEATFFVAVVAVADALVGADMFLERALLVVFAVVAFVILIAHLASILLSNRLR